MALNQEVDINRSLAIKFINSEKETVQVQSGQQKDSRECLDRNSFSTTAITLLVLSILIAGCAKNNVEEIARSPIETSDMDSANKTSSLTEIQSTGQKNQSIETKPTVNITTQQNVPENKTVPIKRLGIPDVYNFLDKAPTKEELSTIKLNLNSEDCGLRKLSVAIIYKYEGTGRTQLFDEFKVPDYKEREQGVYNYVNDSFVTETIKKYERLYPEYEPPLHGLYTFCEVQYENYWQIVNEQRLSIARLFRSVFLSDVLEPEYDVITLVTQIDTETRIEQIGD